MASLVFFQDFKEQLGKATARRWTADDQMEFITCLDHPNFSAERRACINRIKARFQAAQP